MLLILSKTGVVECLLYIFLRQALHTLNFVCQSLFQLTTDAISSITPLKTKVLANYVERRNAAAVVSETVGGCRELACSLLPVGNFITLSAIAEASIVLVSSCLLYTSPSPRD